jgi:hypothetical protein
MPSRLSNFTKVSQSQVINEAASPGGASTSDSSSSDSESSSSDEDDEEEEDNNVGTKFHQNESGVSIIEVSTNDINRFIVCKVCNGYFIKAHTINECLHTFCLRCIPRHKSTSGDRILKCPACNKKLNLKFDDAVKPDRTIQNLVDNFFPSFIKNQDKDEADFYRKQGIKRKRTNMSEYTNSKNSSNRKPTKDHNSSSYSDSNKTTSDDVCFQLVSDKDSDLAALPKPYLRTSGQLRTIHLKKYLIKKLNLEPNSKLQILCNGEVIGKEHSLLYIKRTRWHEKEHLTLHYKLVDSTTKQRSF